MSIGRWLMVSAGLVALVACGDDALGPAELDTRNDACAHCRMSVSSQATASQIVAPGEEPRFFDDLACLTNWLRAGHPAAPGARIFVADHRTWAWTPAHAAVFTRVPGLETPMGSGIVAHESEASRDQDPSARGGSSVPASEILAGPAKGGT